MINRVFSNEKAGTRVVSNGKVDATDLEASSTTCNQLMAKSARMVIETLKERPATVLIAGLVLGAIVGYGLRKLK